MKQKLVFVFGGVWLVVGWLWLMYSQPVYANTYWSTWQSPLRQASGPALTIPTGIMATVGATVTVPVDFRHNGNGAASVIFSIDFDPTCLAFDATDNNGDFTPDAVHFTLPPAFRGSASYDSTDSDGELDIVIADYIPPLATLPDTDRLVDITFTALCAPAPGQTLVSPIDFSGTPSPSFSDTGGSDINGTASGGTVVIANPTAATVTPTGTALPTITPTSIIIPAATPTPTATATPTATTIPTNLNATAEPGSQPLRAFLPWIGR